MSHRPATSPRRFFISATRWCAVAIFAFMLGPTPATAAIPNTLSVAGALSNAAGGPAADGEYVAMFALYESKTGGKAVWLEGPTKLQVKAGRFGHALGIDKPLSAAQLALMKEIWLGVKLGLEPELPRVPIRSVASAMLAERATALACTGCIKGAQLAPGTISADKLGFAFAGSKTKGGPATAATSLACTGCVTNKQLALDGDLDLGGNALKAKAVVAPTVNAQKVVAGSFVGDGSGLTGIKTISGSCKKAGEVVKGVAADGSLICTPALDPSNLPPDALDEVSNKLLTNQFLDTFASDKTPVAIKDNDPTGTPDVIMVPDVGIAQKLSVSVKMTNSDLKTVEIQLFGPDNAKVILYSKSKTGKALDMTWPAPDKTVSGDLGAWVGKNPKGKWSLKVIDTGFTNNQTDGAVTAWSISVGTLSNKKVEATNDLHVAGTLSVGGGLQFTVSAKAPKACDAANMGFAYVDPKLKALRICNGKQWTAFFLANLGTQSNPAKSCKQLLADAPASKSGAYWIDPDGNGPAAQFATRCDMTTSGGGWTLQWVAKSTDYNTTGLKYPLADNTLRNQASEVMIGYTDINGAGIKDWALFPIPAKWRTKIPMAWPATDEKVSVSVGGAKAVSATLRYGTGSFSSLCSHGWTGTWGRLCIIGTKAPFYSGFAHSAGDFCALSNQSYSATTCSANRRFAIYVR